MSKWKPVAALLAAGTLALSAAAQERSIQKEVVVKAPVEAVWKSWTTSEGIPSFFAPASYRDADSFFRVAAQASSYAHLAGEVVQPSEVLHGKPVLVERGSFRPITKLTLDVLERARDQFLKETLVQGRDPVVLMEMTLHDLDVGEGIDHEDFLARADILGRLGFNVLISRFEQYYQLAEYVVGSTDGLIGIAVGLPGLRDIASERRFDTLAGGILESTGRLFKRSVKMYVHPTRDPVTGEIQSLERGPVPAPWHHLRALLLEIGRVEPIRGYDESYLSIRTPDVLAQIQGGDAAWEQTVPAAVAEIIKAENLFGWRP